MVYPLPGGDCDKTRRTSLRMILMKATLVCAIRGF